MNKTSKLIEEKIISLYQNKTPITDIVNIVNVSRVTIRSILNRSGIYDQNHLISDRVKTQILTLFDRKLSCRKIARELNIGLTSVTKTLRKLGRSIKPQKKHIYNEQIFQNIDSEEKAYWLGFLFADGHIRLPNKKKQYILKVSLSAKDQNHLEKLAKFLGTNLKINHHVHKGKNYVDLYINNISIVMDLVALGCIPRKSLILKFPAIQNYVRDFIRGYMDGDGWVSIEKSNRLRIGFLGTLDVLSNILKNISENTGLPKVSIKKRGNIHMLMIGYNEYNQSIFNYLYSGSTIFLERKKEIFDKYLF